MTRERAERGKAASVADMMRGLRLEIDPCTDGLAVTVSGAEHIVSFSDTCVELEVGRRRIAVQGRRLTLTVFENRRTQVSGKVEDIRFL